MPRVTDLEQVYQLQQLHMQIGATLTQIDNLQKKIFLVGLADEQKALGRESDVSYDVPTLENEIVVALQSIRRRSVKYFEQMKDIAGRFTKADAAVTFTTTAPPVAPPVTEMLTEELEDDDGEVVFIDK